MCRSCQSPWWASVTCFTYTIITLLPVGNFSHSGTSHLFCRIGTHERKEEIVGPYCWARTDRPSTVLDTSGFFPAFTEYCVWQLFWWCRTWCNSHFWVRTWFLRSDCFSLLTSPIVFLHRMFLTPICWTASVGEWHDHKIILLFLTR